MSVTARERWRVALKKLGARSMQHSPAASTTHTSYNLLHRRSVDPEKREEGYRFEAFDLTDDKTVVLRIRQSEGSSLISDLKVARDSGVDNTGNICFWASGEVMAYWCIRNRHIFRGKRVCELGAGGGLAGLAVAICTEAKYVLLTDGNPVAADSLKHNVEMNRGLFPSSVTVESRLLAWQRPQLSAQDAFDIVIASDCLYFREHHFSLIDTIDRLLKSKNSVAFLFAPKRGPTKDLFISRCCSSGCYVNTLTTGTNEAELETCPPLKEEEGKPTNHVGASINSNEAEMVTRSPLKEEEGKTSNHVGASINSNSTYSQPPASIPTDSSLPLTTSHVGAPSINSNGTSYSQTSVDHMIPTADSSQQSPPPLLSNSHPGVPTHSSSPSPTNPILHYSSSTNSGPTLPGSKSLTVNSGQFSPDSKPFPINSSTAPSDSNPPSSTNSGPTSSDSKPSISNSNSVDATNGQEGLQRTVNFVLTDRIRYDEHIWQQHLKFLSNLEVYNESNLYPHLVTLERP